MQVIERQSSEQDEQHPREEGRTQGENFASMASPCGSITFAAT
jgi:hypothetical protein